MSLNVFNQNKSWLVLAQFSGNYDGCDTTRWNGFVKTKFKEFPSKFKVGLINFSIQGVFERGQINILMCKLNVR